MNGKPYIELQRRRPGRLFAVFAVLMQKTKPPLPAKNDRAETLRIGQIE